MWETTSFCDERIDDFGGAFKATSIDGCRWLFVWRKFGRKASWDFAAGSQAPRCLHSIASSARRKVQRIERCVVIGAPSIIFSGLDDDLKAKPGARWRTFCSAEDNALNSPLDCSFGATRAGHLVPCAPLYCRQRRLRTAHTATNYSQCADPRRD
jgi:hypothetical protein